MHEADQPSPRPGEPPDDDQFKEKSKPVTMGGGGLFSDVESMKKKLRDNMTKPTYDVADFYVKTGLFQFIARHKWFEMGTLAVIGFNALWISIDTDHNNAQMLLSAQPIFQIAEHFFCTYFSFEWFCRYMSFKRKRDGLKDAWFVFDSIMVFMMFMETWLMSIILLATGASSGGGGMGNASILRLARLLRLSRMMRMARLLRAMPELLILIKGMVAAMRSVFFTLALLAILVYVFGIMFTQLTVDAETHVHEVYFKTVPLSMHTLLLDGALMDGVGQVVRDLGEESLVFAGVFYIFVLLAALTMMNMLIGVLCEVVSAVASTEKEELTVNYVKEKLQEVILTSGLDEDGDGLISKSEFAKIIEIPEACNTLTEVGIDVVGLVDLSDFIFEEADDDDGDKVLSFLDFLEVILQLRGTNTATVKDIVDLRKFVRNSNKSLEDHIEAMMSGTRRGGSRSSTRQTKKSTGHMGSPNLNSPRFSDPSSPMLRNCPDTELAAEPPSGHHLTENGEGNLKPMSAHKSEEKLWVRAGKLEELLLAVQHELANFTEAMTGISPNRFQAYRPGSSSTLGSGNGTVSEPESGHTPSPNQTNVQQNWEVNGQGQSQPSNGAGRQVVQGHVLVPGVPDSVMPPTVVASNAAFNDNQLEDLRKQLGLLEQSLLASMGGLHAVRSKLGGFARNAASGG